MGHGSTSLNITTLWINVFRQHYFWHQFYLQCRIELCPAGTTFNPGTLLCEDDPICPPNSVFNPDTDLCEAPPTCTVGELSPDGTSCIQEANQVCPDGTSDNNGDGICTGSKKV